MPDLSRTHRHLEAGLGANRWQGYTLDAISKGASHVLFGGTVPRKDATVCWYSSGKPLLALGALRLLEDQPHLWDQPMNKTFPELARSYLGGLTLPPLLSHQTGLRFPDLDLSASDEATLTILAQAKPADFQLLPGQPAYDPRGAWWILARWLQRNSGQAWRVYLEQNLFHPLGFTQMFFTEADHFAEIPMVEWKGDRWERCPSMPELGNLCASASDLASFYHILLSGGVLRSSGVRILQPSSLEKFLHPWRQGLRDLTFLHTLDFGFGVILDSNRYGSVTVPYGFGTSSSARSFGHGGSRSSIAFADPESDLAVALCLIGQVKEPLHQARMRELIDLLRSELA